MNFPFFGEIISWWSVSPDPNKIQPVTYMPPPKTKKELQSFLHIPNYLSKFAPVTAEMHELLHKIHSVKNRLYMERDIPRFIWESEKKQSKEMEACYG